MRRPPQISNPTRNIHDRLFQDSWLRESGVLGDESELNLPLSYLQEIYSHIYQYGPRGDHWVHGWQSYAAYGNRDDLGVMMKDYIGANFRDLSQNLNNTVIGSVYEIELKKQNRQFSLLHTRVTNDFGPEPILAAMGQQEIFDEYRNNLKADHDDAYIEAAYNQDIDGLNSYLMNDDVLKNSTLIKPYFDYDAYDRFIARWLTI